MVVFYGFLERFSGFLFSLPLLNVRKIGLFEVTLLFLWGVYDLGALIYIKILVKQGK